MCKKPLIQIAILIRLCPGIVSNTRIAGKTHIYAICFKGSHNIMMRCILQDTTHKPN